MVVADDITEWGAEVASEVLSTKEASLGRLRREEGMLTDGLMAHHFPLNAPVGVVRGGRWSTSEVKGEALVRIYRVVSQHIAYIC